jgi:hypothetical protein
MAGGFLGGVGNMLNSFFHPERGYEEAEDQLRQFWDQISGKLQPWINQGQEQYGPLMGAERALLDPESLLSKWMKGYETSPYAKQSLENARSSGLDAASAQGLLGSSAATQNIQNSASNIMNADRQSYLNDLMQKYLSGVGIGQNIYGVGAGLTGEYGRLGSQFGSNIAGARYGRENAPGNLLEKLLALVTNAATAYFGGSSPVPNFGGGRTANAPQYGNLSAAA